MTYMNRDERRASIVEAAVELILRDRLAAATVRGVAKALNASPGQIHHHFRSADELRAEAFRSLWSRTAPDFNERLAAMPPRRRLITALLGDDPAIEALTARLWNDSLVASGESSHVRSAVRETMEQWLAVVTAAIEAGRATGEFKAGTDSGKLAAILSAYCLGIDIFVSLDLQTRTKDEVREQIETCVDMYLAPAT